MNRNVTAVYRTHAVADLVRRELEAEGISRSHIRVIPDHDRTVGAADADDQRYNDDIHDLHLPDADARTYQSSIRQGDYVVSVHTDDDRVERIQAIMRRPEAEAYNLDARDTDFADQELVAHSNTSRGTVDPAMRGERDAAHTDPSLRSYRRRSDLTGY